MKILAKTIVNLVPNQFMGSRPPLTPEQEALARRLFEMTMSTGGNWAKSRVAEIIRQEMRFTARHMGGEALKQAEELIDGTAFAFGEQKEDKDENA